MEEPNASIEAVPPVAIPVEVPKPTRLVFSLRNVVYACVLFVLLLAIGSVAAYSLWIPLNTSDFSPVVIVPDSHISMVTELLELDLRAEESSGFQKGVLTQLAVLLLFELVLVWRIFRRRAEFRWFRLSGYFIVAQVFFLVAWGIAFLGPLAVVAQFGTAQAYEDAQTALEQLAFKVNSTSERSLDDIARMIRDTSGAPSFWEGKESAVMLAHGIDPAATTTLYRAVMVPYAIEHPSGAQEKQLETIAFEALWFPDHTLVIGTTTIPVVRTLVPVLADRYLRARFGTYLTKKTPSILTSAPDLYVSLRNTRMEAMKKNIREYIVSVRQSIADASVMRASNEKLLTSQTDEKYQADYRTYVTDLQSEYQEKCQMGRELISNCKELQGTLEKNIQELERNKAIIEENRTNIPRFNQEIASSIASWEKSIRELQSVLDKLDKSPITGTEEAGVFISPDTIYIKEGGSASFIDYLKVVMHEMLHYYAFGPGTFPPFLDEGMTEWFDKLALQDHLNMSIADYDAQAYVASIKTIDLLESRIPVERLLDIYFRRDLKLFEQMFGAYFDRRDYSRFMELGNSIYFDPEFVTGKWSQNQTESPQFKEIKAILTKERH
ncbi:MAG: hypothetical protein EXS51_01485 [Candidatus Taylorbacteria bacterium]|nr:hypothetical protein [Candidatus Taylorbacteria bacterium]